MVTVDQIRSMLQELTLSVISLDEFDEWLAKASWNMHLDSDEAAMRLVGSIESRISENDAGLLSEMQLLGALRELAGPFDLYIGAKPGAKVKSSSTVGKERSISFQIRWLAASDKQSGTYILEFL